MKNLRQLRKSKKLSQAHLAELAGTTQPQIYKLESGKLRMSPEWAIKIAPHLGVDPSSLVFDDQAITERVGVVGLPVIGVAEAGMFRDISIHEASETDETISVAADQRFKHARQYALKVSGDSMDRRFRSGDYVTCVEWADCGLDIREGMIFHIERHQGPLVEVTLKRFAVRNGLKWLEPDSTNPAHKPIAVNGDEGTEIIIRGLVTGSWRREF